MPAVDAQLGFKKESVVGTAVTVDKFQEYNSEGIDINWGRIDSEPLRAGQIGEREDRWTPYFDSAGGSIAMDVLSKNFAFFLEHMLGTVGTTGPTDTAAYTHTGTPGSLFGKSFTAQINRPFYETGNQPFTFAGCKIKSWKLSNSVEGNLVAEFEIDSMLVNDATGLASAVYPTLMDNLTFVGGAVTLGGSSVPVTEFSVSMDNKLKASERRYLGNTRKEAVVAGQRVPEWALKCDWADMTQYNRVKSATRAGALASIVASWTGPILIPTCATTYPKVTVTLASARFDQASFPADSLEPNEQELTGIAMDPVAGSSISIVVISGETTP